MSLFWTMNRQLYRYFPFAGSHMYGTRWKCFEALQQILHPPIAEFPRVCSAVMGRACTNPFRAFSNSIPPSPYPLPWFQIHNLLVAFPGTLHIHGLGWNRMVAFGCRCVRGLMTRCTVNPGRSHMHSSQSQSCATLCCDSMMHSWHHSCAYFCISSFPWLSGYTSVAYVGAVPCLGWMQPFLWHSTMRGLDAFFSVAVIVTPNACMCCGARKHRCVFHHSWSAAYHAQLRR